MRRLEPGGRRPIDRFDSVEAWVPGVSRRVLQFVIIEGMTAIVVEAEELDV